MSIEVVDYTTAGPYWRRYEKRFNPGTFGSTLIEVATGCVPKKGQRKRRKASAAVIESGPDRVLALNKGHVYDVTLETARGEQKVRIDATHRISLLAIRTSTSVDRVLVGEKSVEVEEHGDPVAVAHAAAEEEE